MTPVCQEGASWLGLAAGSTASFETISSIEEWCRDRADVSDMIPPPVDVPEPAEIVMAPPLFGTSPDDIVVLPPSVDRESPATEDASPPLDEADSPASRLSEPNLGKNILGKKFIAIILALVSS